MSDTRVRPNLRLVQPGDTAADGPKPKSEAVQLRYGWMRVAVAIVEMLK